ncbi:hypothetical protein Halha_1270 [Halobacteroides halobius DSM 5150]|uniref:Uncharacterized protein n=1 Tax=Halobacteroides halobius (strain ATCC 35273 / DSM 5150 / MD-1) TaxID=748449 RepID=L0K866_HALHC|nr:hypothetical protein [Halobacteroides halobius]AGB41216.1 hypothetical protein Halha_1270 [Halobacteroides halobius DSM 5150]
MDLEILICVLVNLFYMDQEELKQTRDYLQQLVNINQKRKEERLVMDYFEEELSEEKEKTITEEFDEPVTKSETADNNLGEDIKTEETKANAATTNKVIDQAEGSIADLLKDQTNVLKELKLELKDLIKEELIIEKNLKGGENIMAEEEFNIQETNNEDCPNCNCPVPDVTPEEIEPDTEIDFCCVTSVPENLFEEPPRGIGAEDVSLPEVNYLLNKLRCCVEKVNVIDQFGCEREVCIGRAVGCVKLSLIAFPVDEDDNKIPRVDGSGNVVICCESCICIDKIIDAICCEEEADCPCDGIDVEVTNLEVTDIECGENEREVKFTGKLELTTP